MSKNADKYAALIRETTDYDARMTAATAEELDGLPETAFIVEAGYLRPDGQFVCDEDRAYSTLAQAMRWMEEYLINGPQLELTEDVPEWFSNTLEDLFLTRQSDDSPVWEPCEMCQASGWVSTTYNGEPDAEKCPDCGGSGYLPSRD